MLKNRWLVGSWLLGLLITVALVSSIPIYTAGVLQRLLIKDLEDSQTQDNTYPSGLYDAATFRTAVDGNPAQDSKIVNPLEKYFTTDLNSAVGLPVLANVTIFSTVALSMTPQDTQTYDPSSTKDSLTHVAALSNIEKHIVLTDGRLPSHQAVNGVYEAIVPDSELQRLNMVLNEVFVLQPDSVAGQTILVKPVGAFKQSNDHDLFWRQSADSYNDSFILPDDLFRKTFVQGSLPWLANMTLYTAYDYHQLKFQDIGNIMGIESQVRETTGSYAGITFDTNFPLVSTVAAYVQKADQLTKLLWSLNVPVFIMLAFYMFMVSRLIVDREKTEIAVLRSRGASKTQILMSYLIEICVLGVIALVLGPVIGWFLSRILGSSNGFLEFVQRTGLPVSITGDAYLYGLWSLLACIAMVMIPVFLATSQSIVSHKQQVARAIGAAFWHKYFIDVLLLLVSWYGWNSIRRTQTQLIKSQVDITGGLQIDPLLFFIPALFVLGLGLICLRVYPWLVRLVYWMGRRLWSPSMYATLIQVGRSSKQYQFLMVFLVMTLAVGIFSASAARTINTNLEEQIRYQNGADIVLQIPWENDAPIAPPSDGTTGDTSGSSGSSADSSGASSDGSTADSSGGGSSGSSGTTPASGPVTPIKVQYSEPPFLPFQKLTGVEHAAKVFHQDGVTVQGATAKNNSQNTTLMAVDPYDFAQTAWFKPQLLPYHWWSYLNLLSKEPTAVLISTSLQKQLGVKVGQYITVNVPKTGSAQFVVYGVIDYWPTWSPLPSKDNKSANSKQQVQPTLIVANLSYVQNAIGLAPYDIWLKLKPGATSADVDQALTAQQITPTSFNSVPQDLVKLKNSAFLLGLNGSLTLGFLISMSVTFFGFLLYWVLTLSSRRLQYGIFRAMGISLPRLIVMMVWEQVLTSGIACVLGVVVGAVTSRLYVPEFQLFFNTGQQIPPFHVVFDAMDENRLYIFVGAMLVIGLCILGWLLSRIRIHQAVKLGED